MHSRHKEDYFQRNKIIKKQVRKFVPSYYNHTLSMIQIWLYGIGDQRRLYANSTIS